MSLPAVVWCVCFRWVWWVRGGNERMGGFKDKWRRRNASQWDMVVMLFRGRIFFSMQWTWIFVFLLDSTSKKKRDHAGTKQNNTTKRSIIAIGLVVSSTRIIALDILSFISREICKMHTFQYHSQPYSFFGDGVTIVVYVCCSCLLLFRYYWAYNNCAVMLWCMGHGLIVEIYSRM